MERPLLLDAQRLVSRAGEQQHGTIPPEEEPWMLLACWLLLVMVSQCAREGSCHPPLQWRHIAPSAADKSSLSERRHAGLSLKANTTIFSLLFLIENILLCHTARPNPFPIPPLLSAPSPKITPPPVLPQKRTSLQEITAKQDNTDTIRQGGRFTLRLEKRI